MVIAELAAQHERLITTCAVTTETCHLLLARGGVESQLRFVEQYRAGVFDVSSTHAPRLAELMAKYADLPMDLADASLILLAEHLGHGRILSTDARDFRTCRWKQHAPFENLLHLSDPS